MTASFGGNGGDRPSLPELHHGVAFDWGSHDVSVGAHEALDGLTLLPEEQLRRAVEVVSGPDTEPIRHPNLDIIAVTSAELGLPSPPASMLVDMADYPGDEWGGRAWLFRFCVDASEVAIPDYVADDPLHRYLSSVGAGIRRALPYLLLGSHTEPISTEQAIVHSNFMGTLVSRSLHMVYCDNTH